MVNELAQKIKGIKSDTEEKLGRLPLLEKKMNKWIKIFEQSEREGNNRDTEQAKKQYEL